MSLILNYEHAVIHTTAKEASSPLAVNGSMDHGLQCGFHWQRGPWTWTRIRTPLEARSTDINKVICKPRSWTSAWSSQPARSMGVFGGGLIQNMNKFSSHVSCLQLRFRILIRLGSVFRDRTSMCSRLLSGRPWISEHDLCSCRPGVVLSSAGGSSVLVGQLAAWVKGQRQGKVRLMVTPASRRAENILLLSNHVLFCPQ